MTENKAAKDHKDRLFRFIFGSEERKEYTLSLYNALNGSNYTDTDDLTITTLEDVIYMNVKNDVSFLLKEEMSLYEHQSTWNPNMPLRGLIYFGKLYSAYAKKSDIDIYGRIPVSLPTPKYVVLYNGNEDHGQETELRLSDLYNGEGDLEVTARVVNINYEKGKEIFSNCGILEEYAIFVATIRRYKEEGHELNQAADLAIDECIRKDILKELLINHKAEVQDMLITEFDQEQYDRHRRKEGIKEGQAMIIHNMSQSGVAAEDISKMTQIPLEEVNEILSKPISE